MRRVKGKGMNQMLQTYEGYLQSGQIHTLTPLLNTQERRRVIITVLNELHREETQPSPAVWLEEFNRLLEESMDEVLSMDDFPRADFTREHIEVQP